MWLPCSSSIHFATYLLGLVGWWWQLGARRGWLKPLETSGRGEGRLRAKPACGREAVSPTAPANCQQVTLQFKAALGGASAAGWAWAAGHLE